MLKATSVCRENSIKYELYKEWKDNSIEIDLIENAKSIILSLDNVLNEFGMIWNVSDYQKKDISYFVDFVQTHLYSIENRQRANGLLIDTLLKENNICELQELKEDFLGLEKDYFDLKMKLMLRLQSSGNIIVEFKKILYSLLLKEKQLWERFVIIKV